MGITQPKSLSRVPDVPNNSSYAYWVFMMLNTMIRLFR